MIVKIMLTLVAISLFPVLIRMLGMLVVLLFDDVLYFVFDTSVEELIEKYRGDKK